MRGQWRQFTGIAWLTALETMRQPIILLLTTTCIVFIALLPILVTHTLGEGDRLVRDSGLAFHFVCGLVLGSYAACAALTHEIRRGTVALVLSKPVGRTTFFLAKYAGVAVVMILVSLAASIATMMSVRMVASSFFYDWWSGGPLLLVAPVAYALGGLRNFLTRKPFVSATFACLLACLGAAFILSSSLDSEGHWTAFGSLCEWRILPESVLITLAILVLTGIAVGLATRLDIVPTLSICSVVFMIGLISDYLFGRGAGTNRVLDALYRITPNWQHFWVTDALNGDGTIPWLYVARVGVYAALYLTGVLCLGLLAFRRMEIRT